MTVTLQDYFKTSDDFIEVGVVQVEYILEDGEPILKVFGRTRGGDLKVIDVAGFEPYFYIPAEELSRLDVSDPRVRRVEHGYSGIDGRELVKITTKKPADVRDVRANFAHYEADILFPTRFLIDSGITSGIRAPNRGRVRVDEIEPVDLSVRGRVCMIDIECDDRKGFPRPERDPIICLTAWDSHLEEYRTLLWGAEVAGAIAYETEEELLRGFFGLLKEWDPDVLTGWNFNNFDAQYLIKRMEFIHMDPSPMGRIGQVRYDSGYFGGPVIRGRVAFDLLYGYRKTHLSLKESYRLDAIAEEELGEHKVRFEGGVGDLWTQDPDKLVEYNRKDVELCVGIDRKTDIIGFFREVATYVGCPLEDTLNSSRVIDVYVLRKARGKFSLPSKGGVAGDEIEGAVVLNPIMGMRDNVIVLDLKSLYPMAMMTLNASPETKDPEGEHVAPTGTRFKREPDGLTRDILSELLEARDEKKRLRDENEYGSETYRRYDLQQSAIKVIMNSYYGVSAFPRFRLYDREIGAATTSVGRAIIQHTREVIEEMGYEVVYGDTDSCMVSIGPDKSLEEVIEAGRKIQAEVNRRYDEFAKTLNVDHHYFQIKFEKVYGRFLQAGTKKRYAGHLVWKEGKTADSIDITGFEFRRSDYPRITKQVQEEVIARLIRGESFGEIGDYLRSIIALFENRKLSLDEIGIPGGIGKELGSYETDDAHIRGAQYANKHFSTNFGRGSKPKRIYVSYVPDGYPRTDVICFEVPEQVPAGFEPDWPVMLEKTIKGPVERILVAMGWSWSEIKSNQRQMDFSGWL